MKRIANLIACFKFIKKKKKKKNASTSPTLVRQPKVFITANGVGAEVQDHTGLGACGSVSGVGSGGREVREG